MDFLNGLLADLLELFKGDIASLVVVILLIVVGVAATFALNAIRNSDFYQTNKQKLDLLAEYAVNWIFLAEFGEVDLTEYNAKAVARVDEGLPYVDPRMLFVIDKLGEQASNKLGLKLNALELLALAERRYQELKHDENSPVGTN